MRRFSGPAPPPERTSSGRPGGYARGESLRSRDKDEGSGRPAAPALLEESIGTAPRPARETQWRGTVRLALALGLLLLSVYFLTRSPYMHVDADEGIVFASVENIAKHGRFDIEALASVDKARPWEDGLDGRQYSKYGLVQALLPVPIYWLAMLLGNVGNVQTVLLISPLVTALTGVMVFLCGRRLGYSAAVSLSAGLVFGLGTIAWAFAKRLYSEPESGLFLLVAVYWALCYARDGRRWLHALLVGAFLGLAFGVKPSNALVVPLFLGYLVWVHRSEGDGRWARLARSVGLAALGFLPFLAAVGVYDYLRFGSLLHTGYAPYEGFSNPIWQGLRGLLLTPGRSVFLYSPVLLASVAGAVPFVRRHSRDGSLLVALVVAQLLAYSAWWVWWGGWGWGPRFLVPAMPLCVLLLLPVLEALWQRRDPLLLGGFGLLLAASVGVQVLGVAADPWLYLTDQDQIDPDVHGITFTDWRYSPLINQIRYISPRSLDFAWVPGGSTGAGRGVDWPQLALLAASCLLAAAATLSLIRPRRRATAAALLAVTAVAVLLSGYVSLRRSFPSVEEYYLGLAANLHASEPAVAGVLFADYTHNYAFLDTNKTRIPVVGRGEQSPLGQGDLDRLDWLLSEVERAAPAAPQLVHITPERPGGGRNGYEGWLRQHGYLLDTTWYGRVRYMRYAFPGRHAQRGDGSLLPLGAGFGGFASLQRYQFSTVSYDRPAGSSGRQEYALVALLWEPSTTVDKDYTVFVQLLDAGGKVVAQQDEMPAGGTQPTASWRAGQQVLDLHAIPLPENAPAGLTFIVGMYDAGSGARVPILAPATGLDTDFVTLGTLTP
ncbi:MAG: glycosyltransferase family 39 protein [Bacteroidetes bacterium]|nr:glycosyltransferase family 39 protein [Bacteroidota bacterium]MCL5024910.1 glycosyltransferase family 39 protein [Chloroflexota bacterium]